MKYLALKELPDGTPEGAEIELNDDVARVLLLVEAVRRIGGAGDEKGDEKGDGEQSSSSRGRRSYNRRDLKATDSE